MKERTRRREEKELRCRDEPKHARSGIINHDVSAVQSGVRRTRALHEELGLVGVHPEAVGANKKQNEAKQKVPSAEKLQLQRFSKN